MTKEEFESRFKELLKKYHPDTFAKHEDERVQEMATQKFQEVQNLGEKIRIFQSGGTIPEVEEEDIFGADAKFAFEKMRLEILTTDKELKYKLFKTIFKYLERGDRQFIPDTNASIIIDDNHWNTKVGFFESVRMYLTFEESDSVEDIAAWLYESLAGKTTTLIIEGVRVPMALVAITMAIKKKALVELAEKNG